MIFKALNTSILNKHEFTLGIEVSWDSYCEVKVKFVKEFVIKNFIYHVFSDKENKNFFNLRPRYEG